MNATEPIRLERTYNTSAATIWELWTTAAGIESWWAPDGYVTEVSEPTRLACTCSSTSSPTRSPTST